MNTLLITIKTAGIVSKRMPVFISYTLRRRYHSITHL